MSMIRGVAWLHFCSLNDLTAHTKFRFNQTSELFVTRAFQHLPSPQGKLNVQNAKPDWVKGRTVISIKFENEAF